MSVELVYFDSLMTADKTYIGLKDNLDSFEKEAKIIDEAKCYLINYGSLDDFAYGDADIYRTDDGYHLSFEGMEINMETDEQMILDYSFE